MQSPPPAPILVVMGIAGTGKTTTAMLLASRLGWPFLEGDDLHPAANVAKMAAGHPLDDDDRRPWLQRISDWIDERQAADEPAIVTCSALRRRYRDALGRDGVVFVHLSGDRDLIYDRLTHRRGHFMPPALFASQVATLEPLESDERGLVVDVAASPAQQVTEIVDRLRLAPKG
ncbi:MAG: carbohydrate kinase [Microbacterium sp.]|nr:carbohydrate kinase [Microbacterium sp.]